MSTHTYTHRETLDQGHGTTRHVLLKLIPGIRASPNKSSVSEIIWFKFLPKKIATDHLSPVSISYLRTTGYSITYRTMLSLVGQLCALVFYCCLTNLVA